MKNKPILLIAGEPNSIFFEIFIKSLKIRKYKSPLVLICCKENLKHHLNKLNFKKKLKLIKIKD